MDTQTGTKRRIPFVVGMAGCAAAVILKRFDLDFLSGLCLGVSLASFFLGFRAAYRR
jgi:hypothetical protein